MPRLNDTRALVRLPPGHLAPRQVWGETTCNPATGQCRVPGPFLPGSPHCNPGVGGEKLKGAIGELEKSARGRAAGYGR